MEVFIAYSPEDEFAILEQTLNAWGECEDAEPIAVQVKPGMKFEMIRRITADNLAQSRFYILADLGCIPEGADLVRVIERKLKTDDGLIGLNPIDGPALDVPSGVRICQKDSVKRWVPKRTDTYNEEHAESVRSNGKHVTIWPDINFKHLQAC